MTTWNLRPDNEPAAEEHVDVVVVGGGAAGVAAAVTAAESGLATLLVERYGFCGGGAVAGLSGTVCGLYSATESSIGPQQIVAGFATRFCDDLDSRGGLTPPMTYGKTATRVHDPLRWRESADALLTRAGVRIWFHTSLIGVLQQGSRVDGIIVESKAGRCTIRAQRVIDASGDAAVVARAGGAWRLGAGGRVQNPTMIFRLGNVDVDAFSRQFGDDTICPPSISGAIAAHRAEGRDLPREKIWLFPTPRPGELLVNATRLVGPDGRGLNPLDPDDLTHAEIQGRHQVREYARFCAEEVAGCSDSFVIDTGVEVGVRQTRSIVGSQILTNEDVFDCRKRDDGIARSAWPIELHDGERPKLHWLVDDYYEVPFGALVPEKLDGIIAAGRCISAEHEALASARVTAQCFEYGMAAGVATILSLESGSGFRDLKPEAVREQMRGLGAVL